MAHLRCLLSSKKLIPLFVVFTLLIAQIANVRHAHADLLGLDDVVKKLQLLSADALVQTDQVLQQNISTLAKDISDLSNQFESQFVLEGNVISTRADNWFMQFKEYGNQLLDSLNTNVALDLKTIQDTIASAMIGLTNLENKFKNDLENLGMEWGMGFAFIVDHTLSGIVGGGAAAIFLIALLVLGLLTFLRKLPDDRARRIISLGAFAVVLIVSLLLAIVPPLRVSALGFVGLAEQIKQIVIPRIDTVSPDRIVIGQTNPITLEGVLLEVDGTDTTVRIIDENTKTMLSTSIAGEPGKIVATINWVPVPAGTYNLDVMRGDNPKPLMTKIITLVNPDPPTPTFTPIPPPANLRITKFQINTLAPVHNRGATATITVNNIGGQPATNFEVDWYPQGLGAAPLTNIIAAPLGPGASQDLTFQYNYPNLGTFNSQATVNKSNVPAPLPQLVAVQPLRYGITVQFGDFYVLKDGNDFGGEDFHMDFRVNGSFDHRDFNNINDDQHNRTDLGHNNLRPINLTHYVELNELESLSFCVTGRRHGGTFDGDPGSVCEGPFGVGNNWAAGGRRDSRHNTKSGQGGDVDWLVNYNIDVKPLN